MTPGQIARRAFYAAMKDKAPSEVMWEAAAGAVVETCASALENCAAALDLEHGAVANADIARLQSAAAAVRAMKVETPAPSGE